MKDDPDFASVPASRRGPKLIAFGLMLAFAATVAAGAAIEPPHSAAIRRLNAAGASVTSNDRGRGSSWLPWLDQARESYQVYWKGGFGCIAPPFYARAAEKPRALRDEDLAAIPLLGTVTSIDLEDQAIGDAGLEHLRGLRGLVSLNLTATRITDASLPIIESMPDLRSVTIAETALSTSAVQSLKQGKPGLHIGEKRMQRFKGG